MVSIRNQEGPSPAQGSSVRLSHFLLPHLSPSHYHPVPFTLSFLSLQCVTSLWWLSGLALLLPLISNR